MGIVRDMSLVIPHYTLVSDDEARQDIMDALKAPEHQRGQRIAAYLAHEDALVAAIRELAIYRNIRELTVVSFGMQVASSLLHEDQMLGLGKPRLYHTGDKLNRDEVEIFVRCCLRELTDGGLVNPYLPIFVTFFEGMRVDIGVYGDWHKYLNVPNIEFEDATAILQESDIHQSVTDYVEGYYAVDDVNAFDRLNQGKHIFLEHLSFGQSSRLADAASCEMKITLAPRDRVSSDVLALTCHDVKDIRISAPGNARQVQVKITSVDDGVSHAAQFRVQDVENDTFSFVCTGFCGYLRKEWEVHPSQIQ